MRRLLIISFSTIETDPRVRRQLALLKDEFELVVAGFGRLQMAGVSMAMLPETLPQSSAMRAGSLAA